MRQDAMQFIVTICNKVSERNPMATTIVRSAEAFDPKTILQTESEELRRKVKNLI